MSPAQFDLMKSKIEEARHLYGKLDPERFRMLPWRKVELLTPEMCVEVLMGVAGGRSLNSWCREHGMNTMRIMKTRFADPEFNIAYEQACELRKLALEEKAIELAIEGQITRIKKGEMVIERTEYPVNAMLQFILKAEMPNKYGIDRKEVKAGPLETPPETIQGDADRERLLGRIKDRMVAREQQKMLEANNPPIDVTPLAIAEECDLL